MTTIPPSTSSNARSRSAILFIAPAVGLLGHGYHPWIGSPGDPGFFERLAGAVAADPTRWAVSHLLIAVGSGLLVLAFLALRSHLRRAGEEPWSGRGLPFIVMGSVLYALLPAMELAPVAAHAAGADVAAVQMEMMPWFVPILLSAALLFALGVAGFALGIARSGVLAPGSTWLVVGALIILAATRFFPVGVAQLYVGPAAAVLGLWPLGYALWRQPRATASTYSSRRPTAHAASSSATAP